MPVGIDQTCRRRVVAERRRSGALPGAVLALLVASLAVSLAGCGTISDDTAAKIAFAPGSFDIYTCSDLETRAKTTRRRLDELEHLMARAEQDTGGAVMSAIAYRSDYAQTRGEMAELDRQATIKQCAIGNKYSSGRAVF